MEAGIRAYIRPQLAISKVASKAAEVRRTQLCNEARFGVLVETLGPQAVAATALIRPL